MNNQTTEQLKRIETKRSLGLPLTPSENAFYTLYGNFEAVAAPLVDLMENEKESPDSEPSEATQKTGFVCNYLSPLLRATGLRIDNAKYHIHPTSHEETITITYLSGFTRDVCVTADSLFAIVRDVLEAI